MRGKYNNNIINKYKRECECFIKKGECEWRELILRVK